MLNLSELDKIAIKNQTQPLNIYREYCQNLFLFFLYKQANADKLQFKGGTALRIYYQSPRYSEDLDFTTFELTYKKTENLVVNTLSELEKNNLTPSIEESKQTSGGYLANLYLKLYNHKIKIALQASHREKVFKEPNVVLVTNDFIPSYTANLLNENDLIAEKILAAQERAKPRDFFDIYFLLRKGVLTQKHKSQLKAVNQRLKVQKIDFKLELREFLPKSMHGLVNNFRDVFAAEIEKYAK